MTEESRESALDAFALLADASRMRVVAALVLGAQTTGEVVAAAGLTGREVLGALSRLEAGDLVRRDGSVWAFDVRQLSELARDARPKPAPDGHGDVPADVAQVLRRFLPHGRLLSMPAQRSRRLVVLDHIAGAFELGVKYPEREVNSILAGFDDDWATLRRYLVDDGFLTREAGVYWRSGGTGCVTD